MKSRNPGKVEKSPEAEVILPTTGSDDLLRPVLENTLSSLGGRAGIIALWDPEHGEPAHLGSHGLSDKERREVSSLLKANLPNLLELSPGVEGEPIEARISPGKGWEVGDDGLEARTTTGLGLLHLVVFPLHNAGRIRAMGEREAAPEAGETDTIYPGFSPGLVGVLLLLQPGGRFSLHRDHPGILHLMSEQVDLVLMNSRLLQNIVREARWLEAVLQHTAEGLVILDPQGKVLGCNRAFERLTGWGAADIWGRDLGIVLDVRYMRWLHGADDDEIWEPADAIAQAAAESDGEPGPSSQTHELVLTARNGAQLYTEARVSAIRIDAEAVQGAVISFRDVTAEKEAEELQATFLSVISHELQTPLAVIRGYAELLSDSGASMKPAKLRDKLDIIAEESARLSSMVSNLLDASRIQAGGLELHPEPVHIGQMVRRLVQKMEPLTEKHQFVVGIEEDLPPVLADYERVEQVLTNLIENAIKYSPSGGRITITADQSSEEVIVSVSDEGIGVPEAERRRIFSRFARLNSRVVRQMKGVGLGLFIARAIVLAHGGRIWVDAAPGGGAMFSFSLPRQHKAPLPVLFRPERDGRTGR